MTYQSEYARADWKAFALVIMHITFDPRLPLFSLRVLKISGSLGSGLCCLLFICLWLGMKIIMSNLGSIQQIKESWLKLWLCSSRMIFVSHISVMFFVRILWLLLMVYGKGEILFFCKHSKRWGRSCFLFSVMFSGLSPIARRTAQAIAKHPQSIWFDCFCTSGILTPKALPSFPYKSRSCLFSSSGKDFIGRLS